MTPAGLLLDEMLSPRLAEQLRARGHDVYGVVERPDLVQLPDEQVLVLAASERRIVVTLNIADFAVLDARWTMQGQEHAGVLFVSTATFPQDRRFLGAVLGSLRVMIERGQLPSPGETRFLGR